MHSKTYFSTPYIKLIICENCVEECGQEIVTHHSLIAEQVCRVLNAHLSVTVCLWDAEVGGGVKS